VVDRSRRIGKLVRAISRTLARRTGQRTGEVLALNANAGRALARSIRAARALAAQARASARGVVPRPSCARLATWRSSLTAASGSPPSSSSGSVGRRSATGWCR
jgi:hypothetical protein